MYKKNVRASVFSYTYVYKSNTNMCRVRLCVIAKWMNYTSLNEKIRELMYCTVCEFENTCYVTVY